MSEEAVVDTTQQTPSAESQEPMIPKYRLDQLTARMRSLEEALQIKDQAINQLTQAMPRGQQPDEDEELLQAMDPAQVKAMRKLLGKEIEKGRQEFGAVIGALGNRVEEANFLLNHGKDKSKYLDRIREMKREYAMRGVPLDSEAAYKFIRVEELEAEASKPKKVAEAQPVAEKKEETAPPAKLTQQKPATQERTIEDIEAELDEQIKASGGRI